ncbi:MAG: GNAT family N-acetyltransferase [Anaerolineae bacterium]|nr:GNAT family N-acetyltransferase [Anaerolineae bacterium]
MTQDANTRLLALQPPKIPLQIRTVTPKDIDALCADCWSHRPVARSRELIRMIKESEKFRRGLGVVVMNPDDEAAIIAYGQVMHWTKCAEISDLVVSEAYRSRGIGTAIIQYLIHNIALDSIRCIEIGVAQKNVRAAALYRRLGFTHYSTIQIRLDSDEEEAVDYLRITLEKSDKSSDQ